LPEHPIEEIAGALAVARYIVVGKEKTGLMNLYLTVLALELQ